MDVPFRNVTANAGKKDFCFSESGIYGCICSIFCFPVSEMPRGWGKGAGVGRYDSDLSNSDVMLQELEDLLSALLCHFFVV